MFCKACVQMKASVKKIRLRNSYLRLSASGTVHCLYSGRRITPSFSYVTERGEGKMERGGGGKTAKSLSEHV
jgi:hypothetical protein